MVAKHKIELDYLATCVPSKTDDYKIYFMYDILRLTVADIFTSIMEDIFISRLIFFTSVMADIIP